MFDRSKRFIKYRVCPLFLCVVLFSFIIPFASAADFSGSGSITFGYLPDRGDMTSIYIDNDISFPVVNADFSGENNRIVPGGDGYSYLADTGTGEAVFTGLTTLYLSFYYFWPQFFVDTRTDLSLQSRKRHCCFYGR